MAKFRQKSKRRDGNEKRYIVCFALVMLIGVLPMVVDEADAANNIVVCGVDIGVAAGTHMDLTTKDGTKSESGNYKGVYLYATQCFGFARWCQYKMFGYHSRQNQKGYYEVSVNGVSDIPAGQLTASKLKAMISAAKPGAYLRTHENSKGVAHSMIITEITDTGFSIVHANGYPNNEYSNYKQNYIGTYTFTWESYMDGKHGSYGSRGIDYIELPIDYSLIDPTNAPTGQVDNVIPGLQSVTVRGWAYDRDDLNRQVEIRVYIGEKFIGSGIANTHRSDVNSSPDHLGVGEYHGFDFTCQIPGGYTGTQTITVYAIDAETANHPVLGGNVSMTVNIPADTEAPVISDVSYHDITSTGYTVWCRVKDNAALNVVQFPTWTDPLQDDIIWGGRYMYWS